MSSKTQEEPQLVSHGVPQPNTTSTMTNMRGIELRRSISDVGISLAWCPRDRIRHRYSSLHNNSHNAWLMVSGSIDSQASVST